MTVGERIKQKRIELGMSQEELSKKMGYSGKSSVCKAETYGDNITTSKIQRFADALGTTPSYLMGWDDTPLSFDFTPEQEEQELLALWRNAPENIKDSVMILLKSIL